MASHQKRNQFLDKMLIKSPEKLKSDIEKNKIKIADVSLYKIVIDNEFNY